ncbi:hypothetical protein [Flavobacterium selenitireducens]|uniref:hypothetical protein n=1 Tax=Flavobacterium selenitireducens TaxID=2722704 RepID=UPI00168B070D|nr:hypothetical protein [Flavobacterium selenitireducens]MBD3583505.1 hypothetical protein [Flavobacterium selenitireducens]
MERGVCVRGVMCSVQTAFDFSDSVWRQVLAYAIKATTVGRLAGGAFFFIAEKEAKMRERQTARRPDYSEFRK